MQRINWGRLIIGGLIATVILFITDGLLHEKLVHQDWDALVTALGAHPPEEGHATAMIYFFIFELGRGFGSMFLYALMRPFHGAGPKTAVFAGIAAWLGFSVAGPAQFIPLGFYSTVLWVKVGAFQLITSIVAAVAAAALYKDPAGAKTE